MQERPSDKRIDEAAPNGCLGTSGLEKPRMQRPAEMDIVRRAYELWEQAGKPDGRDQACDLRAQQELQKANEQAIPEQPRSCRFGRSPGAKICWSLAISKSNQERNSSAR